MQTVLVAGGAGFIGSHLCKSLLAKKILENWSAYIDKFKSGRFADKDVNEFKELVLKIAKEYKTSAEDVIDQINQKYDIELF